MTLENESDGEELTSARAPANCGMLESVLRSIDLERWRNQDGVASPKPKKLMLFEEKKDTREVMLSFQWPRDKNDNKHRDVTWS